MTVPWARRLGSFRGPFGDPFWDQIGPRGAKMGPRGPSRGAKYRKHAICKNLKNSFFIFLGGPRRSKTASEDARRLPRGYLGLLRAILSHLGGMLSPRASKITPAACDRALGSPSWVLSGSIWGPILGPDRPKRGQDGPKRTIKRCKIPKTRRLQKP